MWDILLLDLGFNQFWENVCSYGIPKFEIYIKTYHLFVG